MSKENNGWGWQESVLVVLILLFFFYIFLMETGFIGQMLQDYNSYK